MNREEEIKKASYKYCAPFSYSRPMSVLAFRKGAQWADKTMIERVCKWLKEQEEFIGISFQDDFIERCKQAMEE